MARARNVEMCVCVQEKGPSFILLSPFFHIEASRFTIGIQHENNYFSTYKHNAALLKKEGDFVKAGEAIAILGESGEQTAIPHLHFELWHNGIPLNPNDYIKFEKDIQE